MTAFEVTRRAADVDDAAQIWAQATAARDGEREVAGLEISRAVALYERQGWLPAGDPVPHPGPASQSSATSCACTSR